MTTCWITQCKKCDARPCTAISSGNSCRQPRFRFIEHPTSHRGEGWVQTDTCVVSCHQFGMHMLSVSSLGATYTVLCVLLDKYVGILDKNKTYDHVHYMTIK